MSALPLKKSIFCTPAAAVTFATTEMFAGAVNVDPLEGDVNVIDGGAAAAPAAVATKFPFV